MSSQGTVEILLAEDNQRDADLTIRTLKKYNIANDIKWVRDGEKALEFLFEGAESHNRLKLILLDLKMPKVDGLEVLKEIRSTDRLRNVPVVMLTSSGEEKDISKSYDLGINSYIVKPVDFSKFVDAVADVGFYWLTLNKKPTD